MQYGSVEIANHERLLAYMMGNMEAGFKGLRTPNTSINPDCYCATAHPIFCEQGSGEGGAYISPALDNAPWYDPDDLASEEFAGFFIEDITGFDGTASRTVSEGAISGSSLGPLRLGGRCMTVTGWLRSKSCCGAEYGLRWLQEALMGDSSCSGCSLNDLYMIKCCPPVDDTCHMSLTEESTMITSEGMNISVSSAGAGVYTIVIDDVNQVNVISTSLGGANNILGFIPVADAAGDTWSLGFTPDVGSNATYVFKIPSVTVTSFAIAASGSGSQATIDIDLSILSDCEDEQAVIDEAAEALDLYITAVGDGVLDVMYPVGMGKTYTVIDGIDPDDYVRLLHRVGLSEGVKVIERRGTCCSACGCTNLKVQFTLCSELPYIYSDIKWCAEEEAFPATEYCYNLKKLCEKCGTGSVGTKSYERQVARPTCGVTLRHDNTWCADGWDTADGCPPADCILEVSGSTEYTPPEDGGEECAAGGSTVSEECTVSLFDDWSWQPSNPLLWNPVTNGFPPPYCDLVVGGSGECGTTTDDPPVENNDVCLIRLIYNECTQEMTWEPMYWLGDCVGPGPGCEFPPACDCVQVAETCLIRCTEEADDCPDLQECPVLIDCDGTWSPVGWVHDPAAAFPDPDCTYVVANEQDTSPIIETIQIAEDIFVPDCGPLPIMPPAPFTLNTSCFCDPWTTRNVCCTITNPGDWNDATTFIEVSTGSSEMRRLKIEAYPNPFGDAIPCPCDQNDEFWECRSPCSSILVPQLPAGSRLVIDSRLHTAQLVMPGGRIVSAMRYLFSADGAPFGWFDIAQCSTFCVVASVDANFVADDAWISIGTVNRYLASGW